MTSRQEGASPREVPPAEPAVPEEPAPDESVQEAPRPPAPKPVPETAVGDGAGPPEPAAVQPGGPPRAVGLHGLRFALGTLTVLPVRVERWDRRTARSGMAWAPLAGLSAGLAAAAGGALLLAPGGSPLLAAVFTVAVPAVLTRGLHLDGLADVADGLGSGKPPHAALDVMKRSDIGPFGVVTLLFVVLGQIAAVNGLYAHGGWTHGAAAVTVAAVTARTALTLAARTGVAAARPEGLGAAVAGTVPVRTAAGVAGTVLALSVLLGGATGWAGWAPAPWAGVPAGVHGGQLPALWGALRCLAAGAAGLLAAELLLRHCRRRLGGVTGDVFGALAETAATAALLVSVLL